jgi:hypothetical protein
VQSLNLKIKGLNTANNELGSVPEGALSVADNIVIDFDNLAQPRRGEDRLTYTFASGSDRANRYFFYQDQLLAHYATSAFAWYNPAAGWSNYSGTFGHPDSSLAKCRAVEANSNFFLSTSAGVKKLDAYTGTFSGAGMYRGLDVTGSLVAGSFFTSGNQAAYRVVWGIKDTNKNLILGTPSQRCVVTNATGVAKDVQLIITIPSGITTSHFFQVYRSGLSGDAAVEPNDELGLVYEANPTSSQITAKSITLTDSTPDSLRGTTIYIAPSQETILQSNDPPPFCKDFCQFKGYMLYINTRSKHRLSLTMLAVGGSSGVSSGDVITIDGVTYTGGVAENVSTKTFQIVTSGTPSQNIADTSLSLIRVINQNTSNTTVYASYLSGVNDLPGKILLEERGLGGSSFAVTASAHGSAYNPQLPTSGTTVASSNDTFAHGLYISKKDQSEAVPITNLRFVGSAADEALRVIPLRDSAFILKEDGVYRLTGTSIDNFYVAPFDTTARIIAPDSAVVLNNQIWCLTDQGVVAISDTGVSVMSRPIEPDITALFGLNLTSVKRYSFGVAYESDRKYYLWTISNAGDTYPTQAFVYNLFTNTWTRDTRAKTTGIVSPVNDKLYLGDALTNYTNIERKDFSYTDFADYASTYTISSSSDTSVILSSVQGVDVGDLLYQGGSFSVITAVDQDTRTVTTEFTIPWSNGSCSVYKGINCVLQWTGNPAGNPGELHQFSEATLFLKEFRAFQTKIGFSTDISSYFEDVPLSKSTNSPWGSGGWGSIPFGGSVMPTTLRTYIPLEKQQGTRINVRLTHRVAYSRWKVQGVSLPLRALSTRVSKI